ncbi:DUF2254 domain-containing protein [Roseibium polysiphoniae]|uniref:DUF2254 domain-containing protein n=1 Tax=Roseibium polysiphoniae TaxID=2571221 RepID=A0ABR9C9M1_9HYPH|nr:DUF2254 domain-containing protein [Roseibium polysiphoniae]MBD8876611.1 DUF2254 domain-containing protein [Roseibium polysiphoniae]
MSASYHESGSVQFLQKLFRGFLFIPVLLALSGAIMALIAIWADRSGVIEPGSALSSFLDISTDGARSVLSTIAGAMMSVISLVYSLTLVVFTLAAGNIGPRLLETFANNRVNQITIGLLGATFLYALIVLYVVGEETVPHISVAVAITLAVISFFWLVYFVNDVSRRIMVDNEIGRTQKSLRAAIDLLLRSEPEENADDRKVIPETAGTEVTSSASGYVTAINGKRLMELAEENDGFIEVLVQPGSYVIEGMAILRLYQGGREIDPETLRTVFQTRYARAPEGDIQFSIHLNVEIALRALSPGINDAYTAISAIDHLSASLGRIVQRGAPTAIIRDKQDTPRVWLSILSVSDILDAALNPLRQASCGNVLVSERLIQALGRMALVCLPRHKSILQKHLRRIASDARQKLISHADREEIARALSSANKTLAQV